MSVFQFAIVERTRKSPFYDATVAAGVQGFTVYNHMLLPTWYEGPKAEYFHIVNNVTMWDVAAERQVEITGPDAHKLVQLMTPRNLSKTKIGQCKYIPITDHNGGLLNDPVLLKLAENHYWVSLADTDILLYAQGIALGMGLDVTVVEPDVSPLAIQGPNHAPVMAALFGDDINKVRFFRFVETELNGIPLVVARSGWSKQGGFELYLRDGSRGTELWNMVAEAGDPFGIKPATPNSIERIESGLLSYGNDMTRENNPFEIGLNQFCDLEQEADFFGKDALKRIKAEGVKQMLTGLVIEGDERPGNSSKWMVSDGSKHAGHVTSATWSPRLEKNIALAMLGLDFQEFGTQLTVHSDAGDFGATVHAVPFM
ncbi:MAG: dimethylsulfoniopropionate demethylase [Chloroflexota bacterium]